MWKPLMNKLVTLSSHGHFQFEFHLISQFFYSIDPEHFEGNFAFRKGGRIDFSHFSSLWMLLWVFIPTSCSHRFSLDIAGNTPTLQCEAAVSSVRKLLRVHSKFQKMHLISVESNKYGKNMSKIYQTHFAFNCQLPTQNASVLLDLLTTVSKSCQYHIIYVIDLTP